MTHRGVCFRAALLGGVAAISLPASADAGAWNQPKGQGQVILKYEPMWSQRRFDPDGNRVALAHQREDQVVSVWGEYGLTDKVTLLLKTDWQDADDGTRSYRGMGPTEVGGRWQVLSRETSVVSMQASYVTDSQGRNAAWGSPGEGTQEFDLRFLAGHSFVRKNRQQFVEVQLARRWRDHLPDETRLEATAGVHLSSKYTILSQLYAGQAEAGDQGDGARWITTEIGAIRHWDSWSAQFGWRTTVAGRQVDAGNGPVVALWRRF